MWQMRPMPACALHVIQPEIAESSQAGTVCVQLRLQVKVNWMTVIDGKHSAYRTHARAHAPFPAVVYVETLMIPTPYMYSVKRVSLPGPFV